MPKVFISHSSLDREFVEREVITPLNTNGIETWYSTDSIRTAEAWERSIREGLKSCDWFLVVMSPNSVASKWVQREVHWAIERREGRVIPVLIEACDPEDLHLGLLPIQHIDFRQNIKKAQKKLLAIWGAERETNLPITEEDAQLKAEAGQSGKSETTPSKVEANLTEAQKLYLDYWTAFSDFLQQHNSFLRPQKPQPQNWFPLAIGRTNFALVATIHRKGRRIATNLSLYGPDAKPHFHLLHQGKTAIEREVGESLEWRELASGKESHIRLSRHKTDADNRQDWEAQHEWLQEKLELFYRVFAQRIQKLRASDYVPDKQNLEEQIPNPTIASPTSSPIEPNALVESSPLTAPLVQPARSPNRQKWVISLTAFLAISLVSVLLLRYVLNKPSAESGRNLNSPSASTQAQQENIKSKWSKAESEMLRRADLAVNLLELVKASDIQEQGIFDDVTTARAKFLESTKSQPQGENGGRSQEQAQTIIKANNEMSSALTRLLALQEKYQKLKADNNFSALVDQELGMENRISVALSDYNGAVLAVGGRAVDSVVGRDLIATTDLNIRSSPSLASPAVGIAEQGSLVRVRNVSGDNRWYEVEVLQHGRKKSDLSSADRGWAMKRYLDDPNTQPSPETSTQAGEQKVEGAKITATNLSGSISNTLTENNRNNRSTPSANRPKVSNQRRMAKPSPPPSSINKIKKIFKNPF
jgi:uncharacterized protein YraI